MENVGDDQSHRNADFDKTTFRVRDLWKKSDAAVEVAASTRALLTKCRDC